MAGYFYPDTDHDNPRIADAFRAKLVELHQKGVKPVFLEFLPAKVPEADLSLEHFVDNSGGRRHMAPSYLSIVQEARRLGMKVIGLSHPSYLKMSRVAPRKSLCYRILGPFDGAVACMIKHLAGATPYVIFLGSGHWPILSHYIDGIQPLVALNESLPALKEIQDGEKNLLEAQTHADSLTRQDCGTLVLDAGCRDQLVIDHVVKRCRGSEDVDRLLTMTQAALGYVPDILQVHYLLTKWRRTEFTKQQPDLGELPRIVAPLELGGRRMALRLRGG